VHHELEEQLAEWKDQQAAVVFPTGFAANLGVLATFGQPGARILSDELNHASIIDGTRLARAQVEVFRHRDLGHVESLLHESGRAIVVSDVVFSMDGDVADVAGLAGLCRDADALLVLDEAHAVLADEPDLGGVRVLRVGTLSKTLGSLGGFVAGPRELIELLVNRARPYIFTTAPSPADTAAALASLQILRSDEGTRLRDRLLANVERLCPGHTSPIVPLVVGDEERAVEVSDALLRRGFLVPAVRPPTVPPGTSRLRVAISAAHTVDQIDGLSTALAGLELRVPVATP
jgi:7-keto-8-aminopelargonate synthetase-like enzyme